MDRRAEAQQPRNAALMSTKLNKRQRIAAHMLGLGFSSTEVAAEVSVTKETICRWKHLNGFCDAMKLAHTELLADLIAERRRLICRSQKIIAEALACDETPRHQKANVALRYLALNSNQTSLYQGLERERDALTNAKGQSDSTFKFIMSILHDIRALKASGPGLSDREYRELAEGLLRKTNRLR